MKNLDKMKISIEQVSSWNRAMNAARWTVGMKEINNEASNKFKVNVLMPQHSPIRLVEYDIKIEGIPYRNAVHFVRHHIGVEKFQCTLRDDRNNLIEDSRTLPQNYPVNLWMAANVEALINISRKRLCGMASKETRLIWSEVVRRITDIDPVVGHFLVPECVYRGFCPEDPQKSCRYVLTPKFNEWRDIYTTGRIKPKL